MTFSNERKDLKIVILRVLDSYDLFLTEPRDRAAPLYTVQNNFKLFCLSSRLKGSSNCLRCPTAGRSCAALTLLTLLINAI